MFRGRADPQYRVEGRQVVHRHHHCGETVLDADAATFRVVADPLPGLDVWREGLHHDLFAVDRRSAWFMNHRIADADPATFEGFWGGQCNWARDRTHVWCCIGGRRPKARLMAGADAASFGFFPEPFSAYMRQYARDAKRVYYYGRRVIGARPDSFAALPEDQFLPDSMRSRGLEPLPDPRSDYHGDGHGIWYDGRRVVGADVASFRCLECGFGLDRNGFWDRLECCGAFEGREHFDLYVAARPELQADYWSRIRPTKA